jgi:hypothetical protein
VNASASGEALRLPLLTNSAISTYRRCPREYRHAYVDLVRPLREPTPFRFGRRWHSALEGWWKALPDPDADPLARAIDSVLATAGDDPWETATLKVLVTGYHYLWHGEPYAPLAVEASFRAPLVNPDSGHASITYELGGKVDGLVQRTTDGRQLLLEHKTTSDDISLGSDYWRRLRIDSQVSTYFTGARALGHEVTACLYDVVRKPTIKPWPANTKRSMPEPPEDWADRLADDLVKRPEHYFQRAEVVRLERDQAEAAHDTWQLGKAIRESERLGRWPRNTDGCFRGKGQGAPCPYFDVCTGGASLSDPTRFRKATQPHEELSP